MYVKSQLNSRWVPASTYLIIGTGVVGITTGVSVGVGSGVLVGGSDLSVGAVVAVGVSGGIEVDVAVGVSVAGMSVAVLIGAGIGVSVGMEVRAGIGDGSDVGVPVKVGNGVLVGGTAGPAER